jgi:uncharacterized protein (DUF362 family)
MGYDFPGKGKVAVLRTQPETILEDIGRVMEMAGDQDTLGNQRATILKPGIASQTWSPARSTTPWQLEGVIRRLKAGGFQNLIAANSKSSGVDAYIGERNNKHKYVVDKYGVQNVHIYEPEVEWIVYEPKAEMLVLHDLFPAGITIPRMFRGTNMIQLPTVSTDARTTIAGAMANAIGGLLPHRRRRSDAVVHEALVDLLTIQREIHPGLFAVMDGTAIGNGPDAATVLASADQVAIDAISASLQGFNPLDVDFIRFSHEKGLGIGDLREIEIVGFDVTAEDWSVSQTHTLGSAVSRNPFVDRKHAKAALRSDWGRLFQSYGDGKVVLPGPEPVAVSVATGLAAAGLTAAVLAATSRMQRKSQSS